MVRVCFAEKWVLRKRAGNFGANLLSAGSHQGRTGSLVGESNDSFRHKQRKPASLFLSCIYYHIFGFQRQMYILRGDKQGGQQLLHGASLLSLFWDILIIP